MLKDISKKEGYQFPPYTFVVERGKIKEFALAIGDMNPIYHSKEAAQAEGYRDVPMPLTFPTVLDMWGGNDFEAIIKSLDLNPLKVLHGEQEYQYYGEICAGDELYVQAKVISTEHKRGMNFFLLETTYTNAEGETVLIARSNVIERVGGEQ
ncbi:MaoC family dehydratase N-terminal domain-containing protein [Brevibacillus dissolubilis]|uniref:MaoC family dehydratase N-terminal domain-containing protein n=1 Tax=Brevibacillus dissolubilis TaxID=1844116 RepID=UPI001115EE79|nr:MaoC family dehydratase N-terminal domain-containing protein [Brevibacillus dissolubilis]